MPHFDIARDLSGARKSQSAEALTAGRWLLFFNQGNQRT
jgi:hypothetical protein